MLNIVLDQKFNKSNRNRTFKLFNKLKNVIKEKI